MKIKNKILICIIRAILIIAGVALLWLILYHTGGCSFTLNELLGSS